MIPIKDEIEGLRENIIQDRICLHRNPELAFHEFETTAFLKKRLTEFGVELEPLNMTTGISALIRGGRPGPTICIRNDMDALPIQEETGLPFMSEKEGVSHACGHDIHAVTAVYCAKLLNERKDQLAGNVRIVIQPAEEGAKGAYAMAEAGAMDLEPKSDVVVGLHVQPSVKVGNISMMKGPAEAASDYLKITVRGKGGHGAYPHLCVDPIVAAAYLVTALQTVVSRESMPQKPAVLTFGTIHGGNVPNAVPDEVVITGTMRSLHPDARAHNKEAVIRLTKEICSSMRAEGTAVFENGIPPVINDPEVIDGIAEAADQYLGKGHVIFTEFPSMGSDDFAVFLDYCRGAQFFIGSANDSEQTRLGLHKGRNIFDPECLFVGIGVLTQYVLNQLMRQ